jgi:hypothetical protein
MAGPLARFITKSVIKTLTKRGKPSKAEKAALTRAANKAGMPVTEFKKEAKAEIKLADKPTPKPSGDPGKKFPGGAKSLKDRGDQKGLTPAEKKEYKKLVKEQTLTRKKGIEPSTEPPGGTIKVLRRPGKDISPPGGAQKIQKGLEKLQKEWQSLSENKKIEEAGKGRKSKFYLVIEKLGPGRKESLKAGAKRRPKRKPVEAPGFVGKGTTPYRSKHQMSASQKAAQEPGEKIKHKLEGTPQLTRRQVAGEMGLIGKGELPTAKELEAMGGFRTNKHGGTVKRNKGGVVRGVGQANKGFGNATYSKKMY